MHKLNDKIDLYYKVTTAAAPIGAIALFAAPFVSYIINKIKAENKLENVLTSLIKNLEDYKKEYTFDKHSIELEKFLSLCKKLLLEYNNCLTNKTVDGIKKFIELSYVVEQASVSAKSYVDDLKNIGGKAFDVLKGFSLNLGLDTLSTSIAEDVDGLHKHLSIERPKLEQLYKDMVDKIQNNTNQDLEEDLDNDIENTFEDFNSIKI